jgi:RNA polymerase sigma-70 factor (ECF subfamily)
MNFYPVDIIKKKDSAGSIRISGSIYQKGTLETVTDEELIAGCLRDEAACQKELFDRYAGRLLGVCHRYARNKSDAEDILQDAFIKIFEKLKQFRGQGSFEGWMRKIVVNTALKKYTLLRYQKEMNGMDTAEQFDRGTSESVHAQLGEKDLIRLINNLPDGYRLVFNLYVMEGYQHEEIAEMLNIQPGTSRSQLVKARLMLQKQIIKLEQSSI